MCNFYIMYWTASPEPLQKKYCFSLGPPMYRWSDEFRNLPAHASVLPARSHQSHYHHHHHYWEVLLKPQKTHTTWVRYTLYLTVHCMTKQTTHSLWRATKREILHYVSPWCVEFSVQHPSIITFTELFSTLATNYHPSYNQYYLKCLHQNYFSLLQPSF